MKLYKELRLQGTHCLYTFIQSEVRKWKSSQSGKVTKDNARINPNHTHIFRPWRKHVQSFKKIGIKLYEELRSQGTQCLYIEVEKLLSAQSGKSEQKIIYHLYPNHMHILTPRRNQLQSFKKSGKILHEELRSQDTHGKCWRTYEWTNGRMLARLSHPCLCRCDKNIVFNTSAPSIQNALSAKVG